MPTRFRAVISRILAAAAIVTLAPVLGRADAKLALHVSPRVATEPATLKVRATVERHEDNRGLHIRMLSSGYCRSSFVQLDGAEAPRTTTMIFPEIPGGAYEIETTVVGPGGKARATATQRITIMSRMGG